MYKVIALMGKAGSGKDTVLRQVLAAAPQVNKIINCTSRPRREGEIDGVNYHFKTVEEFNLMEQNNDLIEHNIFNNWHYGTAISSLDPNKINIGVFNPAGVRTLSSHLNILTYVYYLDVDDKNRLLRQLSREEHPNVQEIIRRYGTDEEDFANLTDMYYTRLYNNTSNDLRFICNHVINTIKAYELVNLD